MKYFVGTAVGKKDFNRVGKCTRDCTGRRNFDFFFFFIHVVNVMLVLLLLTMHFFPPCGKNVVDLTVVSCHGRISLSCLLSLL